MTRRSAALCLALALGAPVAGCKIRREVGHFGGEAFYHVRDHYRIRYLPERAAEAGLLPAGWSVANYRVDAAGRPAVASRAPRFWGEYRVEHARGRRHRRVRAERIDLWFARADGRETLWVRTAPTSESWADAPLARIVRDGVRGLAPDRQDGLDLLGRAVRPSRVRLLADGAAVVDGSPAHFATFDLVPLDDGPVERVTVVVTRPRGHRWRYRRWSFPMLLVFGYASPPARHARYREDFAGLVSRVDVAPVR